MSLPRSIDEAADRAAPVALRTFPVADGRPCLDHATRQRLGRQMRALYDPVIDETLDPRLADLLAQLAADRTDRG